MIPRPHLKNTQAGNNLWDPMHQSMFEIQFEGLGPAGMNLCTEDDRVILTEQVTNVSGLDSLIKVVGVGEQKFMGVTNSYANPTHDTTAADITVEFNLNLRNTTDAYVYNIFARWNKILYNMQTGTRLLMNQYICRSITINEANRDGSIWRTVILGKVILTSMTGLDTLDYNNNEARKLTCTFRADYWDDNSDNANGQLYS